MAYLFLALAIIAEVFGTSMLTLSNGFHRVWPSVGVVVGYGLSFYFLALALRVMPMGLIYATWCGVGIVLICLVGLFAFGQKIDAAGMVGMALIIAGVLVLNLLSKTSVS